MKSFLLPCALLAFGAVPQARGDAPAGPKPAASYADLFHSSAITLISENDKYFAGTDHHYTNGLKLAFLGTTRLDESPAFIRGLTRLVPTLRNPATRGDYKVGVAIGQDLYTPSDTTGAIPDPNDRPYAAWLYASLTFQATSPDARTLRSAEISLGMVGPAALGRQVQNGFHHIIQDEDAMGWDHQLRNEPGLLLNLERRHRVFRGERPSGFGADLIGRYGAALGNIRTGLAAGPTLRLGWHLPEDFGADLIRPGGGDETPVYRTSLYFYAGSQGQLVIRDIFLDGNSWRAGPSVSKRPLVADFDLGLVARLPLRLGSIRGIQLAYSENFRTRQFYGQAEPDVFGSISMSVLF